MQRKNQVKGDGFERGLMKWESQAPSNLALIKYMGKTDASINLPSNPSFSYTLKHLTTTVSLEQIDSEKDEWHSAESVTLSASSVARFMSHLERLKVYFGYTGAFLVKSVNNFPQGVGLASSASSFAALTKCAAMALSELTGKPAISIDEQAALSRKGSGSSCRSFYESWAYWEGVQVERVDTPYPELLHQVILINQQEKAVSSSEAHRRVQTSPDFSTRSLRAQSRLTQLNEAIQEQDWPRMYRICFDEFWDMHQLFETCTQPFSYLSPTIKQVLSQLQAFWKQKGDGPLVTMDAGEAIHLLYRPDQKAMMQDIRQGLLGAYHVF